MSLDKLKSTNNLDKLLSAVKEDNKDPSEKKSYVDERPVSYTHLRAHET